MSAIDDHKLGLLTGTGEYMPETAEHRLWMNEQIKSTLAKKQAGQSDYTPLTDVRRKFGCAASLSQITIDEC